MDDDVSRCRDLLHRDRAQHTRRTKLATAGGMTTKSLKGNGVGLESMELIPQKQPAVIAKTTHVTAAIPRTSVTFSFELTQIFIFETPPSQSKC
jgi:hypothetical protein